MVAIVIQGQVRIPEWVGDLPSFRRWARSDLFPEVGRYSHLKGELWADPSMERLAHNKVKGIICSVLTLEVEGRGLGHFFHDRMMLTNVGVGLATEPDGMFVSHEAVRGGEVRLQEGDASLEVEGTPQMVLEVLSPTSVEKDAEVLRELYWKAGVREYWLVDPREQPVRLTVLRRGAKGFLATRDQGGWLKSAVFGRSFRLSQKVNEDGIATYHLALRE